MPAGLQNSSPTTNSPATSHSRTAASRNFAGGCATERSPRDPQLDDMTSPLVSELTAEVGDLLTRIDTAIANPDVRPLGLIHAMTGTIGGRASVAADLSVIRADSSVQ